MHHFAYHNGTLYAEDVPLRTIAKEVGTPFYCYSTATLERHFTVFDQAFKGTNHLVCFAVKANSNIAVLRTLANLGAGMDVVSEGELRRALSAGVKADKIVFSGVGKTRREMAFALEKGIKSFNVESIPELHALSEVAQSMGLQAPLSLRINPDVDAGTHEKISTGRADDKFGISYTNAVEAYQLAIELPGLQPHGIDMHIGSQITTLKPFGEAFSLLRELVLELREKAVPITTLDLGGGLGIPYRGDNDIPPHPDEYAQLVQKHIGDLGCELLFEPGRMISGNAGILVSQVIFRKEAENKTFLIIDGAMNDLMRPTLYDAFHDIIPLDETKKDLPLHVTDVVGPVCETGDYLARERDMPALDSGDMIAVMSAGAYGASLSSSYNTRPLIPEVIVKGSDYAVIRPRPDYDEIIGSEKLPDWLA